MTMQNVINDKRADGLKKWVDNAEPREVFVYADSFSSIDAPGTGRKSHSAAKAALTAAWTLYQLGLVELVQRRTAPGALDYIAIRRKYRKDR